MAVRTPTSSADAKRLLRKADPRTETGRKQIEAIREWSSESSSSPPAGDEFWNELLQAENVTRRDNLRRALKGAGDAVIGAARWNPLAPITDPISKGVTDIGRDLLTGSTTFLDGNNMASGEPNRRMTVDAAPSGVTEGDDTTTSGLEAGIQNEVDGVGGDVGGAGADGEVIGGYWEGPDLGSGGIPNTNMRGPSEPYYEGDAEARLRMMPTEERARFQEQALTFGLTNRVVPGEIDDGTVAAMSSLMGMANRRGATWSTVLRSTQAAYERGELEGADGGGPGPPMGSSITQASYLPPDPAAVRNKVRDFARETAGVDISDREADYLRDQLERLGRGEFDAMQENERLEAEAQYRGDVAAAPGSGMGVETYDSVAVPSAADRFREFFEKRYEGTIDRAERQGDMEQNRGLMDSSIGAALRPITGGR